MKNMKELTIGLILVVVSVSSYASDYFTTAPTSVKVWTNGTYIIVPNGANPNSDGCASPNWVLISSSAPELQKQAMHSAVMAAIVAGKQLQFNVSGCSNGIAVATMVELFANK